MINILSSYRQCPLKQTLPQVICLSPNPQAEQLPKLPPPLPLDTTTLVCSFSLILNRSQATQKNVTIKR